MILTLENVLSADQLQSCQTLLADAEWVDGRVTAGDQSGQAKNNLQLPEAAPLAQALGRLVSQALAIHPRFLSAALPLRLYPPLFNRYDVGMGFGAHIDNAIRTSPITGERYRTDLSCTLFLTPPEDYDGGELVIEGGDTPRRIKLAAGAMALYPSGAVHRVEPVTRGARWASFFWVQSMVQDPTRRAVLYDLDQAIIAARADLTDRHPAAIALVGVYHNLIRQWAEA